MNIPNLSLEEWLNELKPYQREIITSLVKDYGEEDAIEKWLTANGPSEMVKFGGEGNAKPFIDKFKIEMNKLICGHDDYKKERDEYKENGELVKSLLISSISSAIGSVIGVAGTVIAPVVVLTLYTVGKLGINAYCQDCILNVD